jgi:quinol monooxygenase YgiN
MATPPVMAIMELFGAEPTLFSGPGEVIYSQPVAAFTRASIAEAADPYIVFATLDYKPGAAAEGLQGWKDVLEATEKNEPGTYAYMALRDNGKDKGNRLRMLEAYESEQYLWDVHCKSDITADKLDHEERLKERDPSVVFLRRVAGYLYKQSEQRAVI